MQTSTLKIKAKGILWLLLLCFFGCASPKEESKPVDRESAKTPGCYKTINSLGKRFGFPDSLQGTRTITLKSKFTTMVFTRDSRKLFFNGVLIYLNEPVMKKNRKWFIHQTDISVVIEPLLLSTKTLAPVTVSTVVLDPGHGGRDSGAIGSRKVYEKKVTLDVAKRVKEKLSAAGINAKLTRERDTYISLAQRSSIASRLKADLFVSIHLNSAANRSASGIETYVMPVAGCDSTSGNEDNRTHAGNRYDIVNTLLSFYVHKNLLDKLNCADRGVRRARFDVLRNAPCPAILVECGFLSNRKVEQNMLSEAYRDKIAEGIYLGLLKYIRP